MIENVENHKESIQTSRNLLDMVVHRKQRLGGSQFKTNPGKNLLNPPPHPISTKEAGCGGANL
jgi:hypothetical protein